MAASEQHLICDIQFLDLKQVRAALARFNLKATHEAVRDLQILSANYLTTVSPHIGAAENPPRTAFARDPQRPNTTNP